MKYSGIYETRNEHPSLGIPLFSDEKYFYIQVIQNNLIFDFVEIDEIDHARLIEKQNNSNQDDIFCDIKLGDEPIFAYITKEKITHVLQYHKFCTFIERIIADGDLEKHPFLHLDLSIFINDKNGAKIILKKCCERISVGGEAFFTMWKDGADLPKYIKNNCIYSPLNKKNNKHLEKPKASILFIDIYAKLNINNSNNIDINDFCKNIIINGDVEALTSGITDALKWFVDTRFAADPLLPYAVRSSHLLELNILETEKDLNVFHANILHIKSLLDAKTIPILNAFSLRYDEKSTPITLMDIIIITILHKSVKKHDTQFRNITVEDCVTDAMYKNISDDYKLYLTTSKR